MLHLLSLVPWMREHKLRTENNIAIGQTILRARPNIWLAPDKIIPMTKCHKQKLLLKFLAGSQCQLQTTFQRLFQIDPETNQPSGEERTVKDTPLLINIKGCGYPPEVNCDIYSERYQNFSLERLTFPCHYSVMNPWIVISDYDRFEKLNSDQNIMRNILGRRRWPRSHTQSWSPTWCSCCPWWSSCTGTAPIARPSARSMSSRRTWERTTTSELVKKSFSPFSHALLINLVLWFDVKVMC